MDAEAIVDALEGECLEPWTCTTYAQRIQTDTVFLERIVRYLDLLTPHQHMRLILSLVYCPPPEAQGLPQSYKDMVSASLSSDDPIVAASARVAWAVLVEGKALRDVEGIAGVIPPKGDDVVHCTFLDDEIDR